MDLEKIKCVETVEAEPNAPQERMYAFQVKSLSFRRFQISELQKPIKQLKKQRIGMFPVSRPTVKIRKCVKAEVCEAKPFVGFKTSGSCP